MPHPEHRVTNRWRVGDRVEVRDHGDYKPARISSIHRAGDRIEYVVHTDPVDGGIGSIVNVDGSTGRLRTHQRRAA